MAGTKNSGRKKTPTAILKKRRSRLAKARAKQEVAALPDFFVQPKKMDKLMQDFYKAYVPLLKKSGILSGTDSLAFESLARTYCRLKVLNDKIGDGEASFSKMFGVHRSNGNNKLQASALIKLAKEYEQFFFQQLQQFGLTPSSRVNVHKIDLPNAKPNKLT